MQNTPKLHEQESQRKADTQAPKLHEQAPQKNADIQAGEMLTCALTQEKDSELFWMRDQFLKENGIPDSLDQQKTVRCACGSSTEEGNMVRLQELSLSVSL